MKYPRDCLDRLLTAMRPTAAEVAQEGRFYEENERSRDRYQPIPTPPELEALLDVAYAASMLPEEGRYLRFGIAFIAPDAVGKQARALPFDAPKAFSPIEVSKVGPSADPDTTFLGVWREPTGALHVWGLLQVRERLFSQAPIGDNPTFLYNSAFLVIRVRAPGVLFVYHGQYLQLLYARGEAYYRPRPGRLLEALRDRAEIEPSYANSISQIAARIALLGHGGIILITDPVGEVPPDVLDLTYRFQPPVLLLKSAIDEYERSSWNGKFSDPVRNALDSVAQLSQIDGAVHMTSDLGIRGFGGKIRIAEATRGRLEAEDPDTEQIKEIALSSIRGMRHRSAALFCMQQRGQALAIVVSQDGDVTLFGRHSREDGSVLRLGPFAMGTGLAVG